MAQMFKLVEGKLQEIPAPNAGWFLRLIAMIPTIYRMSGIFAFVIASIMFIWKGGVMPTPPPVIIEAPTVTVEGRHHPIFQRLVRERLVETLKEKGKTDAEAWKAVAQLSDTTITANADQLGLHPPLVQGPIIDWISQHQELFATLLKVLLLLLAGM